MLLTSPLCVSSMAHFLCTYTPGPATPRSKSQSCSDLHGGDPNAELPYLLVEKQGCEGSFKKGLEQENNGTVSTCYHISLGSRGNLTLCGANLSTFPSCPGSSGHALWSRRRCFCISLPACCRKSWWCHRDEKEVIFFSDYSFIYPCS